MRTSPNYRNAVKTAMQRNADPQSRLMHLLMRHPHDDQHATFAIQTEISKSKTNDQFYATQSELTNAGIGDLSPEEFSAASSAEDRIFQVLCGHSQMYSLLYNSVMPEKEFFSFTPQEKKNLDNIYTIQFGPSHHPKQAQDFIKNTLQEHDASAHSAAYNIHL